MKKILSLFAILMTMAVTSAWADGPYNWDGCGVTSADDATEVNGKANGIYLKSGVQEYNTSDNMKAGVSQKGNWTMKINKGYKDTESERYFIQIALDNAIEEGDTLKVAAFRTSASACVMGIDFSADSASASTDVQVLFPDNLQVLSSNGTPVDTAFVVPEYAVGKKYVRVYRKSGSTGLFVAHFEFVHKSGQPEPTPTPQSGYEIKFTEAASAGSLNGQTLGTDFTLGITDTGSKIAVDANSQLFGTSAADTVRYAYRLKTGGKSSSGNCMTLTIPVDGTLYIYARTGSNSATDRNIVVTGTSGTVINHILLESDTLDTRIGNSRVYLPVSAQVTAGTYDITYPTASVNIYGFKLLYNTPTAVKQTQTQVQVQVEKFIINGQLYIRREGKTYNAIGTCVE